MSAAMEMSEKDLKEYRHIIKEIINTETSYVNKLGILYECLAEPLLARKHVYTIADDPRVSIFLSSITQIYQLNSEFLADLKSIVPENGQHEAANGLNVGDIFGKYATLFRCYRQYSKYFDVAKHVLHADKSTEIVKFLADVNVNPRLENQTIEAYYIKPIQRVPQYLLFLKQLMRVLPEGSEECTKLFQAETDLSASVAEINEAIKNRENVEQLFALEAAFKNAIPIFAVGRKFVKQDELEKVCRSYNKKYTFHLFSDMLTYSSQAAGNTFNFHRSVDLNHCILKDLPDKKNRTNAFQVVSHEKSFIVCCASPQQKREWLDLINAQIYELKATYASGTIKGGNKRSTLNASQALRGMSSEEKDLAPVWVPDEDQESCTLCNKNFTMIRRRHHCRRCGLLVCGNCSKQTRILSNISDTKPQRICDPCVPIVDQQIANGQQANAIVGAEEMDENEEAEYKVENTFPDDARFQVLRHMLETELEYVASVESLHEVFVKPLLTASLSAGTSTVKDGQKVKVRSAGRELEVPVSLISGRLATVLSEIENLYTLNSEFLEDLESHIYEWYDGRPVGDMFLNYAPLFKLYGEYGKGHSYASKVLSSDDFSEYMAVCAQDSRVRDKKVSSFLMEPLLRLPIYVKLVKELINVTPEDHVDRQTLQAALEKFAETGSFITEAIRLDDNQEKIRELENKFTTPLTLAQAGREFVREGELEKVNRTGKSDKYYFHLFNDILMYSETVGKDKYKHHKTLTLAQASVRVQEDNLKFNNAFTVASPQKTIVVATATPALRDQWVKDIAKCIESCRTGDEDGFVAPEWKSDDTVTYCSRCYSDFTMVRRRHHCRLCGDLVCDSCSKHKVVLKQIDLVKAQRVCDSCYEKIVTDHSKPDN
eukprot:TRINITY_DN1165_c0_g1_i3.p1 TRINITY_DN1165_c0_g1~~TRINITY_DN1165_c0_g1_i3.p1  ORF type:complete len:907 (-),score=264.81 TRINITY_DN1165_c0_g1_i3:479-3130(-)